jgi:cytoskeleton protein RodZ
MSRQQELIPMRPGDLLRYEREQKGLSIEGAARQARIKPSVLIAIETGETGEIPSVYLRGYIRNYARFLGVNPTDLEEQLEHVRGAEPEVQTVFTVNARRGPAEKWLKASSYLVASALIATLAWQFTHQAVRFSQGEAPLASATSAPADRSEPANGEADSQRPANTHITASIASVEMLKDEEASRSPSPAEQAWAAIGEAPSETAPVTTARNLAVTTSADTWVEITDAAGEKLELDLIRAGSTREYQGEAPFEIMIGRASAVSLTMDGAAVDLGPHTRGNVARMTLDPE